METILSTFIDTLVPEVRRDVFHHADDVLVNIGITQHQFAADSIISRGDDMDHADLVQAIEFALANTLIDAITEYGIGIAENNINVLPYIILGMHDILSYENAQELLDICDEDDDSIVILSTILSTIYSIDVESFMSTFEYVNDSLIMTIETQLNQHIQIEDMDSFSVDDEDELDMDVDGINSLTATLLKRLISLYPNPTFDELLAEGFKLGYRYQTYIEKLLMGANQVELLPPAQIAMVYLTAGLAAGEDINTITSQAETRIDELTADTADTVEAVKYVIGYIAEVNYEEG